jgi:hypothetical protein
MAALLRSPTTHAALNRQTPAVRLAWLLGNNVVAHHI